MSIALLTVAAMVGLPVVVLVALTFASRKPTLNVFPARGVQPRRPFTEGI